MEEQTQNNEDSFDIALITLLVVCGLGLLYLLGLLVNAIQYGPTIKTDLRNDQIYEVARYEEGGDIEWRGHPSATGVLYDACGQRMFAVKLNGRPSGQEPSHKFMSLRTAQVITTYVNANGSDILYVVGDEAEWLPENEIPVCENSGEEG